MKPADPKDVTNILSDQRGYGVTQQEEQFFGRKLVLPSTVIVWKVV